MYGARMQFDVKKAARKAVAGELFALMGVLCDNGQILPSRTEPIVRTRKGYEIAVSIPERGSLSARHANKQVRQQLACLKKLGAGPARVEVLGPVVESAIECRCRTPSSYILFTHFLNIEPPVRCGDCFGPVALYRLPPSSPAPEISTSYRDLLYWQEMYLHSDALYMMSGLGERFGQRQMEDVDSALSKMGRDVAESLELRVKRPVYYFLNRTSETRTERKRRCPSCRGAWLLKKPWHGIFDFRCRKCRLVSNVAWGMQ